MLWGGAWVEDLVGFFLGEDGFEFEGSEVVLEHGLGELVLFEEFVSFFFVGFGFVDAVVDLRRRHDDFFFFFFFFFFLRNLKEKKKQKRKQ